MKASPFFKYEGQQLFVFMGEYSPQTGRTLCAVHHPFVLAGDQSNAKRITGRQSGHGSFQY